MFSACDMNIRERQGFMHQSHWQKFREDTKQLAAELRELTDKERRKHCRYCSANPEY